MTEKVDDLVKEVTGQDTDTLKSKIQRVTKGYPSYSLLELCRQVDASVKDIEAAVAELNDEGYDIEVEEHEITRTFVPPPGHERHLFKRIKDSGVIKFGIISDTHYGNIHSRQDVIEAAYDHFEAEGIDTVYLAGNLIDGYHAKINHNELLPDCFDLEGQLAFTAAHFPKKKGIITYYIAAEDHEGWWHRKTGLNIGRVMQQYFHNIYDRKDLNCVGFGECDIELRVRGMKKDVNGPIMRLSHPGGGSSYAYCFDETTEIMTKERGWVLFKDLDRTECVATLEQGTHTFTWQRPTDYIEQEYTGELLRFSSRTVDLLVTPNHRMYVRRYPGLLQHSKGIDTSWQYLSAEQLEQEYGHRQKWQLTNKAERWLGTDYPPHISIPVYKAKKYGHSVKHIGDISIDDYIRLAGWFITEGSGHKNCKQFTITQSETVNKDNHTEIRELLDTIGVSYGIHGKDNKDFSISSKELAVHIVSTFGRTSGEKRIPTWMKELPSNKLRLLLDTLIKGDGWIAGSSFAYRSISKQLRDDVEEIALKCGFAVSDRGDTVHIITEQCYPTINTPPERVQYAGKVYCVSVPNQTILVRRNGKVTWSGNSYKTQKQIEAYQGGEKPQLLIVGHFHKYDANYHREVLNIQIGCCEDQTWFMRKHNLAAHVGYVIAEAKIHLTEGTIESLKHEFVPWYDKGYYHKWMKREV